LTDLVRSHPDGAVLAVRAVPGASAAKVMGLHGDELRVRVCSPPIDGRANDEVIEVLARAIGLRSRDVALLTGHSSRSKQLLIALSADELLVRLRPWIEPEGAFHR
jgi:uncharacterized protein (TIGR00251 family)